MARPTPAYFALTGDTLVDGLTNGYYWQLDASKTIDFSLSNGFLGESWNRPDTVANYLTAALATYSYYADVRFNYVGYYTTPVVAASNGSDIDLSVQSSPLLFSSNAVWAMGLFPNSLYNYYFYSGAAGDLFLNVNSAANSLPSYEPGSQGWFLLIHELGHVLGLKHPHDDGGTGRPTFTQLGLENLNIDWATVMSYNDTASLNLISWDPATPMILDVLALQYLYGKNLNTNAGDSISRLGVCLRNH